MTGPNKLNLYLEGWTRIASGSAEAVAAMVGNAHPDICFSDVNVSHSRHGHEGLRAICALASQGYPGATIDHDEPLFDGRRWSIRWTMAGRRADGTSIAIRGASAGLVADDGRVIEHCDYWSRPGASGTASS